MVRQQPLSPNQGLKYASRFPFARHEERHVTGPVVLNAVVRRVLTASPGEYEKVLARSLRRLVSERAMFGAE